MAPHHRALAIVLAVSLLATACVAPDAAPSPSVEPTATPVATPTPTPSPSPPPRGCESGFVVQSGALIVRINERAGPITIHEAVIESKQLNGGFELAANGALAACSAIAAELRGLVSTDQFIDPVRDRDEVIQKDLLNTARYPYAVLQPREAKALPSPLPLRGQWSFDLTGELTLHGRTKTVVWHVEATRQDATLAAKATTTITFLDFEIERPQQILGLDEQIRIEVQIQAQATS